MGVNFFPGHLIYVPAESNEFWLLAGRTAIYIFDGAVWTDISSVAGYASIGADDELLWNSCLLGSIPIVANPQHFPEYWNPQQASQVMQPLMFDAVNDWNAKGYTFKIIRAHKSYLFALDLFEGVDHFPDGFRWSHPASANGLPPTWDETDNAFLAGKGYLGGDGGTIMDGLSLRDSFCIYSEGAIDILDSTNDEAVWRRRELSFTTGLLSKEALVEVKGKHLFLADGDIVGNNGNRIESIAHNRIRARIRQVSSENLARSYAVRNDSAKEAWFCVPEEGAEYANLAFIYNWKDDSWAIRDLPYESGVSGVSYASYGSQRAPATTWAQKTTTWASDSTVWGSAGRTPLDDTIVGCEPQTGSIVILDPLDDPDEPYQSKIERTDIAVAGQRQVTTITRVYPHMDGTQPVQIEFGSQAYAGAPVQWKPAVTFNPNTDRKVDIRTTGELHAYRINSDGTGQWALSGMTIEFELNGLR